MVGAAVCPGSVPGGQAFLPGLDKAAPGGADVVFARDPAGSRRLRQGQGSHVVGDVGVVGVVAGPGKDVQPVDDGADLVVLAEGGVVEGEGEFKDGFGSGDAGVADLGA